MRRIVVLALSLLCVNARPAAALDSPWMAGEFAKVRLLSAYSGVADLPLLPAGLEVELAEGWHTYWRMAGDSGLPPKLEWSGSENLKNAALHWPTPSRFEYEGLNTFGYSGTVLFPLDITPQEPGKPVTLALTLDLILCKEICIPQQNKVQLTIPAGQALRTDHHFRLEKAVSALPVKGDAPDLKLGTAVLGKNAVVVTATAGQGFDRADVIIEAPGDILTRAPEIKLQDDPHTAIFTVPASPFTEDLTTELMGKKITVTLINRGTAVEKDFQF